MSGSSQTSFTSRPQIPVSIVIIGEELHNLVLHSSSGTVVTSGDCFMRVNFKWKRLPSHWETCTPCNPIHCYTCHVGCSNGNKCVLFAKHQVDQPLQIQVSLLYSDLWEEIRFIFVDAWHSCGRKSAILRDAILLPPDTVASDTLALSVHCSMFEGQIFDL